MGLGMALAAKMDGADQRIFVVTGDGEMQAGQVWEALMAAPKFKLDNLTLIVDCNNGQIDGHVNEIMALDPLAEKLKSFNWDTRTIDGHDLAAIDGALSAVKTVKGKPQAIVARTIKGKGVSFMEDNIAWHGKAPNQEECERALKEILHG